MKAATLLAAGLSLAVLVTACSGARQARPDDAIDDPRVILAALEKRGEAIRALTAELGLEVWREGDRVRLRQLVLAQKPDRVRIDTLSPFDQPLTMMASNGEIITIYSLEEKRFWRGPATPENLARLLPLRMESEEMSSLLRGSVPLIRYDDVGLGWDDERGCYLLTLRGPTRRQRLCVEPKALRVAESRVWRGDELLYRARFGQYEDAGPVAIPRRMRFEVPAESQRIDIEVRDVTVDPDPPADAFHIDPPRGIEVEPLD